LSAPSTAPHWDDGDGVFRIVHPFHPACGRKFAAVTVRHNWGEEILYYKDQKGKLVSIPAHWTDKIEPDPVVAVSAGRSPFRLEDLLELTRLVEALEQEVSHER
jgi:hypothetical protein